MISKNCTLGLQSFVLRTSNEKCMKISCRHELKYCFNTEAMVTKKREWSPTLMLRCSTLYVVLFFQYIATVPLLLGLTVSKDVPRRMQKILLKNHQETKYILAKNRKTFKTKRGYTPIIANLKRVLRLPVFHWRWDRDHHLCNYLSDFKIQYFQK